jgi:acetyl-CoA acetyltransferase family protein
MYKTADVYIIDARRTPVGKLYGSLASIRPDDLISGLISGFFKSNEQLVNTELDALILGCGNQAGEDNRNIARMAVLLCGLPHTVYAATVNSLCSSGLDSVLQAARMIACGEADFCLAGGVESMSRSPFIESRVDGTREDSTLGWRFTNDRITDFIPTHSMPETAELLSKKYSISRAEQDNYAFLSRNRYESALKTGFYNTEILPVFEKDKNLLLDRDEQHRILSISLLEQLPTLVKSGTHITLGNSARIGDGAAIVALASENYIKRHNIQPLARIAAMANAAEHPDLMRLSCLHEEITQGLGLANDSPAARPSIFNDDEEFALLTPMDELMLKMLYNPLLTPGMTEAEARPIVDSLATALVGGES